MRDAVEFDCKAAWTFVSPSVDQNRLDFRLGARYGCEIDERVLGGCGSANKSSRRQRAVQWNDQSVVASTLHICHRRQLRARGRNGANLSIEECH